MFTLMAATAVSNGHSLSGGLLIGFIVALFLIILLIGKLFKLIFHHPFISLILFLIGGFAIFKFAIYGRILEHLVAMPFGLFF
ncbi:hypothetical protein ACNAN0_04830 [Agrilactobacillus fermenti]|uniref:hypothetical protein n=1 Tax=Agrilactobacillus fermenti TaxID=2586909 RepID=UPI003A5BBA32